jgi:hypothetical protein
MVDYVERHHPDYDVASLSKIRNDAIKLRLAVLRSVLTHSSRRSL